MLWDELETIHHFLCPSPKYIWSAVSIITMGAGDRSENLLRYFYWIARQLESHI